MDAKAGGCEEEEEEEDCVDSGAETGGSDYSHLSSTSSELSVEEAQDPFLVSIHIIADPGESRPLQEAIDEVLAWIHPDLPLFRVSERRAGGRRRRKGPRGGAQPALAVVLFLQEDEGQGQILQLHRALQRPPWRHHHTERVHGRFVPYLPCSQDFFTLAPGTPLWAIRPVHYGREIVRFTIYCRHDSYADSLRFYELILRRSPSQKKADFCIFPIFSNLDVDIQFSLKRLPGDQSPVPTDSSVLEFRVKDIGELVPLLPNPCSPISEGRWQTEDHDGNKILLQFRTPAHNVVWAIFRVSLPSSVKPLRKHLHGHAQRPRGCITGCPNTAEPAAGRKRSRVLSLRRAPAHRAASVTARSQGPAQQLCFPASSRNMPPRPAAPAALPGLSREASPCSVCPAEAPPQPPRPNRSGFQTRVPGDRGHPGGSLAFSCLLMT
uniref:protein FAM124A isoform X2 n=1 Tax=Jaculus jaculus TaxID=51337 RepID=UPI001E1B3758|nr:protein FAM124A isoform X2 [Jaculus jaculus]